jgi:phosphomannomutase/phosphoglucomutase
MAVSKNIPDVIFKAYDIRGIVDETLTADIVFDVGQAFGSEAKERGQQIVVVGRDGRLSGPKLMRALTEGLRKAGIDVIDIGMAPTPVIYYAAQHLGTGSCIALTGSHNPPNYNGLKMVIGGVTLSGDTIQKLKQRIINNDVVEGDGKLEKADVISDYIKRIVGDVKLERKLKLVIDCGNGVAGAVAPELFKQLGCDITEELFCDIDGSFPNHHPDPSKPENLQDLIKAVKETGADLGFAFDGDGDRLGVVTPEGDIIWPDRQMMLYAKDVLERNPGATIIFDIKCTTNLPKVISENGGKPLMWTTGHSLIKAKLKETGAPLAGEMSGHIFFKERWYGFDDGTYTGARLLEILAKDPRSAQEIFSSLPDSVNTPELNILMNEGENFKFVKDLVSKAKFEHAKVTTIDGIRVDYEDGFGLVRASNTTPSVVIRFEANDQAGISRIQEEFRTLMLEIDPKIKLPF